MLNISCLTDSVDKVMTETHQLGGATIAVDRATPKVHFTSLNHSLCLVSMFYPDLYVNDLLEQEDVERERNVDKHTLPYGVFNSYLSAAARLGFFAMPQMSHFDYPGYMGGSGGHGNPFGIQSSSGKGSAGLEHKAETGSYHGRSSSFSTRQGHKIFIGRLPLEATTDEVRSYFSKFGLILDVYLPKVASPPFPTVNMQFIHHFHELFC
jgi:RNA-binding protein Musashi